MVDKPTSPKLQILSLYRSNYLAQYYVRELAKLAKKSHVTLLPHLKALEKDKILIAKISGKNKVYSLNNENIIAKSYLLLAEVVESITYLEQTYLIKKIIAEISNLNLEGGIILFGSYAKRTFKDDSDIDLFYLGKISDKQIEEIKKIAKIYGRIINIKKSELNNFGSGLRKKEPLILEIIKNHIILQNPDSFINALWGYYNEIR